MAVDTGIRLLEDRVLVDRARRGDAAAFDELFRRHAPAAWRLAWAVVPRPELAEGAVIAGFGSTLSGPGVAPNLASGMRLPLLAATRHAALDAVERHRAEAHEPLHVAEAVHAHADLAALHAVPELWRTTYWLVDVEGASPADAGLVLGVAPGAAALAARARTGLRKQVLAGAQDDPPADCRRTLVHLVSYAAGSLAARDEARVRAHLDACEPCRDRLATLDDLPLRLRAAVPVLPVALAGAAAGRWSASLVREAGPLRLVLPGGQPVPAWAERVVAGAAAAAIALGVTAAILAGGRNRSHADDLVREAAVDEPFGAGDGEVALGGADGLADLVLDSTGAAPAAAGAPAPSSGGSARPAAAPSLPRSSDAAGGGTAPGTGSGPAPTTPPRGPGDPPPPPPPPEPAPVAQVTVGVADAVAVTVGDACVGIELLGNVIGCEPSTSDAPVTATTEGSLLPPLGL